MASPTDAPSSTISGGPYDPTSTPLSIGSVIFRRIECPTKIPGLGATTQKLVEHEFTGGSKVTNKFGAQPVPVSWTGFLWQPYLAGRVTALRQMNVSGAEVSLTWLNEKWFAIVKDFDPGYEHANKTEYKITVAITRSANGALAVATGTPVDTTLHPLGAQATSLANTITAFDPGAPSALVPLVATVNTNIAAAGPIAQAAGSPASTALSGSISSALAVATKYLGAVSQTGSSFVPAKQLVSALNLMALNITRGQSPTTVRQQGGSTYEMASTAFGDITRGLDIATFNNAVSTRLSSVGVTSTILPAFAKS